MEMLETLGLPTTFEGSVGHFLKHLSEKGTSKMIYKDPQTQEEITFETHEQLDMYVRKKMEDFMEQGNNFQECHPDDWTLLKGFDRAFWLYIR